MRKRKGNWKKDVKGEERCIKRTEKESKGGKEERNARASEDAGK